MLIEPLYLALAVAGLLIGATGTWSPCGFSMIETIGPTGHTGGLSTTLAASATFAPAAVAGGALTFGLLGLAGEAVAGAGGTIAWLLAAAVAIAAALAEARGTPIVPQVRRQLPIGWRRTLPMPAAAAGYGVLLGLGFTTFVLSYGVWALMGVSLALGDPTAGLIAGIAFGVGRALPIIALAPIADRRSGERACEAMAMRPGLLRSARIGDALALLAVAGVLLAGAGAADAARTEVRGASDPSTSGPALAYELGDGTAVVEQGGKRRSLPGSDPAIGGPYAATVEGSRVVVRRREDDRIVGSMAAAGADALAVSKSWLGIRRELGRRDVIEIAPLNDSGAPGAAYRVAGVRRPGQLSRPAIDGELVVYTRSKPAASSLIRASLRPSRSTGSRRLVSSRTLALAGPSISGSRIAYVVTSRSAQTVRVKGLGGGLGRTIHRQDKAPPTLWTTAIAGNRVIVTSVAKSGSGKLISVGG